MIGSRRTPLALAATLSLSLAGGCASLAPPPSADWTAAAVDSAPNPTAEAAAEGAGGDATAASAPPSRPAAARRANAAPKPDSIAPQATGPAPEILVTANDLTGYWRVTASKTIQFEVGLFSGVHIIYSGEMQDRAICLIRHHDPRLFVTCSTGRSPTADGTVDGDRVTLRWWNGPANLIFDGSWDQMGTINGAFSGGVMGMSVTGRIPATLKKMNIPDSDGDARASIGALRGVLDDLHKGVLTEDRYEAAAVWRLQPALAWRGAKVAAHSLTYLGQIHVRWQKGQPDLLEDVYEVRSGDTLSLCRIGLSERGRVVDFGCQDAI
jgi:hypothetical protein